MLERALSVQRVARDLALAGLKGKSSATDPIKYTGDKKSDALNEQADAE